MAATVAKPCDERTGISPANNVCPCGNAGFLCMWGLRAPLETRVTVCPWVSSQMPEGLVARWTPWTCGIAPNSYADKLDGELHI
jgi:hypothetical protein